MECTQCGMGVWTVTSVEGALVLHMDWPYVHLYTSTVHTITRSHGRLWAGLGRKRPK